MGRDHDQPFPLTGRTLAQQLQAAVFPFFQGAPDPSQISAKAGALARVMRPEFGELADRIVADARALAESFASRGYTVVTGGTDTHLVVVDVGRVGLSGLVAERALEGCGIVVNKNTIPGDTRPPRICSGIRFGTNSLALRGMMPDDMARCADLVDRVLSNVRARDDSDFELAVDVVDSVGREVADLCARFPIPCYPVLQPAEAGS